MKRQNSPVGCAGTVIVEPERMLVEGGYLHSMKLMIEKASATPAAPDPRKARGSVLTRLRKRGPFSIFLPLKRLGVILLGSSFQR